MRNRAEERAPIQAPVQAPVQAKSERGTLSGCLVEGESEQQQIRQKLRRRALGTSLVLQSAALTLLLLLPLLGKSEPVRERGWVPLAPYGPPRGLRRAEPRTRPVVKAGSRFTSFNFRTPYAPPGPVPSAEPARFELSEPGGGNEPGIERSACPLCPPGGSGESPLPPEKEPPAAKLPERLHLTRIDPALLKVRVEPVYPVLARQAHHGGRVELRAIIGTDGKIRSLQVVAGDPLLTLSAIQAVEQWVYRPTYLNGQAVEVDTYITVIYSSPQ